MDVERNSVQPLEAVSATGGKLRFSDLRHGKHWLCVSFKLFMGDSIGGGLKDTENRGVAFPKRVEDEVIAYYNSKSKEGMAEAWLFFVGTKAQFKEKWKARAGKIGGFLKLRKATPKDKLTIWAIKDDWVKHRYIVEWHCILPDKACFKPIMNGTCDPQPGTWYAHADDTDRFDRRLADYNQVQSVDWLTTPTPMPAFIRAIRKNGREECMKQLRDLMRTTVGILNPDVAFDKTYLNQKGQLTLPQMCRALGDGIKSIEGRARALTSASAEDSVELRFDEEFSDGDFDFIHGGEVIGDGEERASASGEGLCKMLADDSVVQTETDDSALIKDMSTDSVTEAPPLLGRKRKSPMDDVSAEKSDSSALAVEQLSEVRPYKRTKSGVKRNKRRGGTRARYQREKGPKKDAKE